MCYLVITVWARIAPSIWLRTRRSLPVTAHGRNQMDLTDRGTEADDVLFHQVTVEQVGRLAVGDSSGKPTLPQVYFHIFKTIFLKVSILLILIRKNIQQNIWPDITTTINYVDNFFSGFDKYSSIRNFKIYYLYVNPFQIV